jgi:serine carboxypeptidase-like clade II
MGPYVSDGTSTLFPFSDYTWAKNASLLFVDNPAGVGFSYAERIFDSANNDHSFRRDILTFVKQFYSYWPQRRANPLYIYGISYGGIYAPHCAWEIHQHNLEVQLNYTRQGEFINLKGFIIGNGATDYHHDPIMSTVDVAWSHNLFSRKDFQTYKDNNCKFWWKDVKPNAEEGICSQLNDKLIK